MSRGLLISAVVVSLAWAIGIGSYAIHERDAQAHLLGEYIEDNCMSQKHDVIHCFSLRDDAEEQSKSSFPVGTVALLIGVPIGAMWGIVWFVRRRQRRRASIATAK